MTDSNIEAQTVLAIDIGSIHTRALLFDVVDGQYRFVSASRVPSTARAPFFDISEAVFQAIHSLESITGRSFLEETSLVIPSDTNGVGIDQLVMTFSTPQALKVAVIGLLDDVSLESARRLVYTTHCQIVEQIGLNDRRKNDIQIDALLQTRPDLVVIAGGTEDGATRSVGKLIDLMSMALQIVPKDNRPQVLYAGNQALAKYVKDSISQYTDLQIAPNIRPDIDQEVLGPAQEVLSEVIGHIRTRQIGGLQSYSTICSAEPSHSSQAFGRMIRFLSQINNPQKGVLGVDLGASSTTIAAAHEGILELNVSSIGLGAGLARALDKIPIGNITRWIPLNIPVSVVRDILTQKTLFPGMISITKETLSVEQAISREILSLAMQNVPMGFSKAYEPILANGQVLTQSTPGQSLLMLLDSVQPGGVTTFVLDPHGLTPALGAIAKFNTILPVQVIESNAYVNLGTVLSPISNAKNGTIILQVRVEYEAGESISMEIPQGTLTSLPVQPGQSAKIHLRPMRPIELNSARRDSPRSYKIIGGACGAVIDTRGRPIHLPKDDSQRREILKKWNQALNA